MNASSLPESVQQAIKAKVGSTRSLTLAWERAAAKAQQAGASCEQMLLLIRGFEQSRSLDRLLQDAARVDLSLETFFADLRARVDESDFSFEQWLEAWEAVERHLVAHSRSASPLTVLGYIQCSAEFAAGNEAAFSLAELVEQMLSKYGFEG